MLILITAIFIAYLVALCIRLFIACHLLFLHINRLLNRIQMYNYIFGFYRDVATEAGNHCASAAVAALPAASALGAGAVSRTVRLGYCFFF